MNDAAQVAEGIRRFVTHLSTLIADHHAELDSLDSDGGDGDHGTTMSLAVRGITAAVDELQASAGPAQLLETIGNAFGDVGGSVGPLWSAAAYEVAATFAGANVGPPMDTARTAAHRAVEAIQTLGGANEGDGTMLDALLPALRTLDASPGPLAAALAAASAEADTQARSTAGQTVRIGRASRAGAPRTRPDPGATSAALILRAITDAATTGITGLDS